jgi:indole-3-glycerol phosphate synthase
MGILNDIVDHKRREVAARKEPRPLRALIEDRLARPDRDFEQALREPGMSVIAEFKRRSPSKGPLRESTDVREIAPVYAANGASAISVLTDKQFFGGSEDDLRSARSVTTLPVLRKDFIIDEYQIHESACIGADAILLIVRILTDVQLRDFIQLARDCNLPALVETHDEDEIARALDCGARIVGVNSRNLDTFEVSLDTALRLKAMIPPECITVAESGIHTRDDVERLQSARYDAILVGETLMRASDSGRKLAELLGAVS